MPKPSFAEKQHAPRWTEAHNLEMALVLALERHGYSRSESRRLAEMHRAGVPLPIQIGHNGGPPLDD